MAWTCLIGKVHFTGGWDEVQQDEFSFVPDPGVIKVSELSKRLLPTRPMLHVRASMQWGALAVRMASIASYTTLDRAVSWLSGYMLQPVH